MRFKVFVLCIGVTLGYKSNLIFSNPVSHFSPKFQCIQDTFIDNVQFDTQINQIEKTSKLQYKYSIIFNIKNL